MQPITQHIFKSNGLLIGNIEAFHAVHLIRLHDEWQNAFVLFICRWTVSLTRNHMPDEKIHTHKKITQSIQSKQLKCN